MPTPPHARTLIITAAILALLTGCASQPGAMYAVAWDGKLLRADLRKGQTEQIGLYPSGRLNCLAANRDNELYTIRSAAQDPKSKDVSTLLRIDPGAGEFHTVAQLSLPLSVRSLSFDDRGLLIAIAEDSTTPEREDNTLLYEVDINTGECKLIGPTGRPMIQALCLAPDGSLYGYNGDYRRDAPSWGLIRVYPRTAGVTRLTDDKTIPNVQSIACDARGTLYAIARDKLNSKNPSAVYVMDPGTGWLNQVMSLNGHDVRGIEFLPSMASHRKQSPRN